MKGTYTVFTKNEIKPRPNNGFVALIGGTKLRMKNKM